MATIAEIMKKNRKEIISLMVINKRNSLELIDNLMDLKVLMDKIDQLSDDKMLKVTEIERITRKVLDEIKKKDRRKRTKIRIFNIKEQDL